MALASPPSDSSTSAVPPAVATNPPPPFSPPPPSPQPNAESPDGVTPSTSSTPTQSSPAAPAATPPAAPAPPPPPPQGPAKSPPPPSTNQPPPTPPPENISPSPSLPSPPNAPAPSPPASPPPSTPNSPAPSNPPPSAPVPPQTSPPPPRSIPPDSSPPPPPSRPPPQNPSPPPPNDPPGTSPAPPPSNPPKTPPSEPPQSSPPPPPNPPQFSPPPPASNPPEGSPPPSNPEPPSNPTPAVPPPPGSEPETPSPSQILNPPSVSPPVNNSSPNGTSNPASKGGIGTVGTAAIGVALGLVLLFLIGLVVLCLWKRKKKATGLNGGYIMPTTMGSSPRSDSSVTKTLSSAPLIGSGSGSNFVYSSSEPGGSNSRSWFTYEELVKATNGFSIENLLGEGGFGSVYKGYLPDGREVAVKQLKIGGGQGEREFRAEVETISRIHHRYLVSLVGYCISDNRRLLVYDYVPNNTLYFHLHGEERPVMDWATRVKVAIGAARGIAYLHEDCHPRIIHRDIKSSNILLDYNFEARVSDFGLAKLALDADTHITTRVMGTFGYMAPEYASSGKLTEKSDVFSFGVVLLELITGRKPVDPSQPLGDESLVEWARPLLSHALEKDDLRGLVDPRLENNYVENEMFCMIEAAAVCVRHSAAKRPRMGQVVRAFDSMATSDLCNGMKLGESELFNSAQQSEEIRWFRRAAFGNQDSSTDFFSQGSWNS